jgi:hypothetical protein
LNYNKGVEDNFDTDAAGILIGDDICDPITALAASNRDEPPASQPAGTKDRTFAILALGGLVCFILWLLVR